MRQLISMHCMDTNQIEIAVMHVIKDASALQ